MKIFPNLVLEYILIERISKLRLKIHVIHAIRTGRINAFESHW
jgi:hypothetical protein